MGTNKIKNAFVKFMKVMWPDGFSFKSGNFKGKMLPRLICERCTLVLLLVLILLTSATVQAQAFLEWAKKAGGIFGDDALGLAVDASGNSYVTGGFRSSSTFAPGTILTTAGSNDIFVAKYNSSGDLVWVKQAGGSNGDIGRGIAVDGLGNSFVTGDFRGTVTFGPGETNQTTLTSIGDHDIFVAKYNSNGDLLWVKQAGGSNDDRGRGIGVDGSGNSYVTGFFAGTATFGPVNAPTLLASTDPTDSDIFVAKYNPNGVLLWAKQAGGSSEDKGRSIAVDVLGNSYLTSIFSGTATFGSGTILTSVGSFDIFVAKYNSSGDIVWAKQAGGLSHDIGYRIAVDASGNSYVTGFFFDSATFGMQGNQTVLSSTGANDIDIFVAKYNSSGNLVWVKRAGGSSTDVGSSIAVDVSGSSYVTGSFAGSSTFGPEEANQTILTSAGTFDIFVAKYNSSGDLVWAKRAGGSSDAGGLRIAVDTSGNSYVTGNFEASATFGLGEVNEITLPTAGYRDIFVAKFGQCTQRTITFAGRTWIVRQAYAEGPGKNNWSACQQSVWVDAAGLHLKIRYDAVEGKWYSAEVFTKVSTQHGIHRFNITTPAGQPLDGLDKNVVLGLFLLRDYPDRTEPGVPFEIDIEFAKWGMMRPENVDYVVFHNFDPLDRTFKSRTMDLTGEFSTSHFIDWAPSMIQYSSFKGQQPTPGPQDLLSEWNTTDDGIPAKDIPKEEKNLKVHINLWLINSDGDEETLGDPPSDGQEVEIIVQDVRFPDSDNDGIFDVVDTTPTTSSNDFSDGTTTGTITDRGGQVLTIVDSPEPFPDDGVLIKADPSGGAAAASIMMDLASVCNTPSTFSLSAGDSLIVTCGSVTIKVLSGTVEIALVAADGTPATTTLNAGNSLTFDPTTFTFTTPATNAVTSVILVNGTEFTLSPGAILTLSQFDAFDVEVKIKEDEFEVEGSFTLEAASNGIDPLTEDVTMTVGTFTTIIPAGSFEKKDKKFKFKGKIDGVKLKVEIKALSGGDFKIKAKGKDADLSGTVNPVEVTISIGDDTGATSVIAEIELKKVVAESTVESSFPEGYGLFQNHPNPFNPKTTITFAVPEAGKVTLAIYNLRGQLIQTLYSGEIASGRHSVVWHGTHFRGGKVASGIYVYKLKAKDFVATRKLVFMK